MTRLRVGSAKPERQEHADTPGWKHRHVVSVTMLVALLLLGSLIAPREVREQCLVASGFLLTIGLGGLFFVLLHYAVAARWSAHAVRHVRCAIELLAGSLLFVVPLVWRFDEVLRWLARPALVHRIPVIDIWLREGVVLLRLLFCYAVWFTLGYVYTRSVAMSSRRPDVRSSRLRAALSGPALVVFGVTLTSFSFDWVMALQHGWHSTVMGVYVFAGGVSAALAFLVLFTLVRDRLGTGTWPVDLSARHDLAKLLFGFNMFWGYIAFSQYLLTWYAGIPSETEFYHRRLTPAWQSLTLWLMTLHFVLPLCCLLSARAKRSASTLLVAALAVLAGHWLDWSWLVLPALSPQGAGRASSVVVLTMTGLVMVAVVMTGLIRELQLDSQEPMVPSPAE